MHPFRLGKGQGFSDKASQALAERIVPAFDVGGGATMLGFRPM